MNLLLTAGNAAPAVDPTIGLATRQVYGAPTLSGGTALANLTPQILARYLQDYAAGRFADVAAAWDAMERREEAIVIARGKRLRRATRMLRNWQILTLDDSPRARRQQAYLTAFYNRLRCESALVPALRGGLKLAAMHALDSLGKGYSLAAKVWSGSGDTLALTLKPVPLWHFRLVYGSFEFLENQASAVGAAVTPEQWLIAAQPHAIMEAVSVLTLYKRLPTHQLVAMLEKWGVPNVYGQTSATPGSVEWNNLLAMVQAFRSGQTGVIGNEAKLDSPAGQTAGMNAATLHRPWIERCDTMIIAAWMGGALSSLAQRGAGTLAGNAQAEDADDLTADDLEWFSETMQEQIDRDALLYGLGDREPLAYFSVSKPDKQDIKLRLQVWQQGVQGGVALGQEDFRAEFELPTPAAGAPVLVNTNTVSQPGAPAGNAIRPAACCGHPAALAAANAAGASPIVARAQRELMGLEQRALRPVGEAYAALWAPLLATMRQAGSVAAARASVFGYEPVQAARNAFAARLQELAFAANLRGLVQDRPARKAANRLRLWWRRGRIPAGNAELALTPLPFDEAVAWWRDRPLVIDLGAEANSLWEEAGRYGFKVAGISSEAALRQIHGAIEQAITGELTIGQAMTALEEQFGVGAAHAETIVRTNVQTAYQQGHWRQLNDPAVVDEYPYLGIDVVVDDATSEICLPLRGMAWARADVPYSPPLHYNCRSTLFAIGADEIGAYNLQGGAPLDPATGGEIRPLSGFGRLPSDRLGDMLDGESPAGNKGGFVTIDGHVVFVGPEHDETSGGTRPAPKGAAGVEHHRKSIKQSGLPHVSKIDPRVDPEPYTVVQASEDGSGVTATTHQGYGIRHGLSEHGYKYSGPHDGTGIWSKQYPSLEAARAELGQSSRMQGRVFHAEEGAAPESRGKAMAVGHDYGAMFGLDAAKGEKLIYLGEGKFRASKPGTEKVIHSLDTEAKIHQRLNTPGTHMGRMGGG